MVIAVPCEDDVGERGVTDDSDSDEEGAGLPQQSLVPRRRLTVEIPVAGPSVVRARNISSSATDWDRMQEKSCREGRESGEWTYYMSLAAERVKLQRQLERVQHQLEDVERVLADQEQVLHRLQGRERGGPEGAEGKREGKGASAKYL